VTPLRRFLAGLRLRLLLTILVVPVMAGCQRPPRTADDALDAASTAYALGCVALEVADSAASAWLSSLDAPTETDIARGEQMVAALVLAHDALVEARAALVAGRDALAEVREAVALLRGVAGLLGDSVPPALVTALDAAERVIGGKS